MNPALHRPASCNFHLPNLLMPVQTTLISPPSLEMPDMHKPISTAHKPLQMPAGEESFNAFQPIRTAGRELTVGDTVMIDRALSLNRPQGTHRVLIGCKQVETPALCAGVGEDVQPSNKG